MTLGMTDLLLPSVSQGGGAAASSAIPSQPRRGAARIRDVDGQLAVGPGPSGAVSASSAGSGYAATTESRFNLLSANKAGAASSAPDGGAAAAAGNKRLHSALVEDSLAALLQPKKEPLEDAYGSSGGGRRNVRPKAEPAD